MHFGHFHLYSIDVYYCYRGGLGGNDRGAGENGTITGKSCPRGLYGTFCEVYFRLPLWVFSHSFYLGRVSMSLFFV